MDERQARGKGRKGGGRKTAVGRCKMLLLMILIEILPTWRREEVAESPDMERKSGAIEILPSILYAIRTYAPFVPNNRKK